MIRATWHGAVLAESDQTVVVSNPGPPFVSSRMYSNDVSSESV